MRGTALLLIICFISFQYLEAKIDDMDQLPGKRKLPKDPLYITDMDLEKLYDEWEDADEEKLPPDELPSYKRPPSPVKRSENEELLFQDPEKLMRMAKKGQTQMTFIGLDGNPTREQTEELTQRWQVGLSNNHMKVERFVVADDRAVFVFADGSQAFEAKDFIVSQPEVKEYSIDGRNYKMS